MPSMRYGQYQGARYRFETVSMAAVCSEKGLCFRRARSRRLCGSSLCGDRPGGRNGYLDLAELPEIFLEAACELARSRIIGLLIVPETARIEQLGRHPGATDRH